MKDSIEKVVELAAPISRVWRALSDHVEFGKWFRAEIDGPFEVGRVLHAKTTDPEHDCVAWEMVVENMDTERLFSFRWGDIPSQAAGMAEPHTLVVFRLEKIQEGTRLTIIESGFSALSATHRHEVFRDNTTGWNEQARNITSYVEA